MQTKDKEGLSTDSEFVTPSHKRRKSSSGSEGLLSSPIRDNVVKNGEYVVVYIAVDFKHRKPGSHSAGFSIFFGEGHTFNETTPLRGDDLTPSKAQLVGKYFR